MKNAMAALPLTVLIGMNEALQSFVTPQDNVALEEVEEKENSRRTGERVP